LGGVTVSKKYIKPLIQNAGIKSIPVEKIWNFRKTKDGLTEIWLKPIISCTPIEELQDEMARAKQW
jgi:hypothetical protein|tara:strand:- start:1495 stop:1692 length:198 start_codon:yes stop_codon:yes gene_type:complete